MTNTVFENEFLAIRKREDYYFYHTTRTNGKLVVVVPYRKLGYSVEYLARVEICPAHSLSPSIYSITGGVNAEEIPLNAANRELAEESGYYVENEQLIMLGQLRPSKQSDTIAYLYTVDLSDVDQQAIEGDGSHWENKATVKWVSFAEGLQVVDTLFLSGLLLIKDRLYGS
jgi:ADP-ribose pyrophosphatase YjhB (NUDIX family)